MVDYNDTEMQEIYLEQLKENYLKPHNLGILKDYDFRTKFKNPSCGDSFELFVKLDENNKIKNVKYNGSGCAISTASMSLLSQKIIGMDIKEAKSLTPEDIYELIGIKISPNRINCAMLSLNILEKGIKEYLKEI